MTTSHPGEQANGAQTTAASLWRHPAVKQALGVAAAAGTYGVGAGALGVAAGLSVWQTMLTSLLLFSGASQLAFFGVITAGGAPVAAVASSTLLGARNAFYGVQMARILDLRTWRRPLAAHLTIDESTAVAVGQRDQADQRLGFWATGIACFILWNSMTLVGALAGNAMGDPADYGLDAAAAAAFIALVWPRFKGKEPLATAAIAVVLTVAVAPFAPAGVPVLIAALAALTVGIPRPRHRPGAGS